MNDARTDAAGAAPPSRTGGRLLVAALRLHGVDRLFCVPGESFLDILDALYDTPDIQVVVAKHEGAAANMAEADGKLTGRPGICLVTRGPGATHASVGVHTADHDSTPMILLVGQVARALRGRGAFQELEYRQMFSSFTKWVTEVPTAAEIPTVVARAFHVAMTGRPGPVVLSLPEDVLAEDAPTPDVPPHPIVEPLPSTADLAAIRNALGRAERPLVVVGGSQWSDEGRDALQQVARVNDLPVVTSFRRQDVIDNASPSYVGHLGVGMPAHVQHLVTSADLLLALGTRLGDVPTKGYSLLAAPRPQPLLIHVHPDPLELNRVYHARVGVAASPSAVAIGLSRLPPVESRQWSQWTAQARSLHVAFSDVPPSGPSTGVDLAASIRYLSNNLPAGSTVANGAGNFAVWVHRFFAYRSPGTQLAPTSGAMGYGLPAAIAASLRRPDALSVCVAGDGDFLMYAQELATARQHGARVIVLLINNGRYGTIRMHQEHRFPGRACGTDLWGPDYVALARAYGAYAESVVTTDAFAPAWSRAIASGRTALLELRVDPDQLTPDLRLGHA